MTNIQVRIPAPLSDCFEHCETQCVSECCGIDAFTSDQGWIGQWVEQVDVPTRQEARQQLDALIDIVEDHSSKVSSELLNFYECDADARQVLRAFLFDFRSVFGARE